MSGNLKNCVFDKVQVRIEGCNPILTNCAIRGSSIGILCRDNANPTLSQNDIVENSQFGLRNEGSNVIDARNNWWGDATGPKHSSNPDGIGNAVSDNVNFSPWLTQPNLLKTPIPMVTARIDGELTLKPQEEFTIQFDVSNAGEPTELGFLSISVTSQIEIVKVNGIEISPSVQHSAKDGDAEVFNYPIGEKIFSEIGETFASNQLVDITAPYGKNQTRSFTVTIKAKDGISDVDRLWYRAALQDPRDFDFVRDPDSGSLDQQRYPAHIMDIKKDSDTPGIFGTLYSDVNGRPIRDAVVELYQASKLRESGIKLDPDATISTDVEGKFGFEFNLSDVILSRYQ